MDTAPPHRAHLSPCLWWSPQNHADHRGAGYVCCDSSPDSECTRFSSIPKSGLPVLIDPTTKSAHNRWLNRQRRWSGSLLCCWTLSSLRWNCACSQRGWSGLPRVGLYSNCCDSHVKPVLMELNAFKPWLVRPANELNFSVRVYSSHVKRVLTRCDCADLDDDFFLFFFC